MTMNSYDYWILNDNALIIEKYTGKYELEDVLISESETVNKVKEGIRTKILIDLTEAEIQFEEHEVLPILEKFKYVSEKVRSLTIAIWTDSKNINQFIVPFQFTVESIVEGIPSMIFHSLESALEWLDLSTDLQKQVKQILKSANKPLTGKN